jgi:CysZ protein
MPLAEARAGHYLLGMFRAAALALGDLLSPRFRSVILKAIGLTLLLFAAIFAATEAFLSTLTLVPWAWLNTIISIGAGLALFVAFFFLMSPVTAMFGGLYFDKVAALVEEAHYPGDPPGAPLPALGSLLIGFQFTVLALLVSLAALVSVLFGVGAIILIAANAYLISREYFEMAAMRHMPVRDAKALRRRNFLAVFASGFLPAILAAVPIVNITVPVFATSYFTHLFKAVRRSSA